jgi:hypothetical protein
MTEKELNTIIIEKLDMYDIIRIEKKIEIGYLTIKTDR